MSNCWSPVTLITTVVTVKNRHVYCRLPQSTGCKLRIWWWLYYDRFLSYNIRSATVVDRLKMEYPIVCAHSRYDEIRSLPHESNTIKNGRLRPCLIDLGVCWWKTSCRVTWLNPKLFGTNSFGNAIRTLSRDRDIVFFVW